LVLRQPDGKRLCPELSRRYQTEAPKGVNVGMIKAISKIPLYDLQDSLRGLEV